MYDNPVPKEGQEVKGTITIRYKFVDTFPPEWGYEEILAWILTYHSELNLEFEEIEEVDI